MSLTVTLDPDYDEFGEVIDALESEIDEVYSDYSRSKDIPKSKESFHCAS